MTIFCGMTRFGTGLWVVLALALTAPSAQTARPRQNDEGDLRKMRLERFVESRPAGKKSTVARNRPGRFQRKGPALPAATAEDALIGITIWRLRPPVPRDSIAMREILHKKEGDTPVQAISERVGNDRGLDLGQDFRLSIETPRQGYLYVIDRAVYADGKKTAPYLIFPTQRIREGDNAVLAGRVVELPSRLDRPNFFTIEASRPGLQAEEVIVLVAPEPLPIQIGQEATELTNEQVEGWEQRWGVQSESLELVAGEGASYSTAEREAGSGTLLTRDDPLPQTIYRIAARPGAPLFLRILIQVRDRPSA